MRSPLSLDFRSWRCLSYPRRNPHCFTFLSGSVKNITDEPLFLELARRGYDLEKLREDEGCDETHTAEARRSTEPGDATTPEIVNIS